MKRTFAILGCLGLVAWSASAWSYGGAVPAGLPGVFGIGTIDKNDNWGGDQTGPHRWKYGQGCYNYSYQYLTGPIGSGGWRGWSSPDGQWALNEMQLWEGQGENQVFTFYYNNGAASLPAGWFGDLMVLMQKIQSDTTSTKKVIIHIEPDFLGFCIQKSSSNYNATGIVKVGSDTMPAGWPGTGTQAWNTTNYPDTLQGWAKAIRDMQTLVAPNRVLIAHHFTVWGASSGSSGDAFGQPTSQADVDSILTQIHTYLSNIGGGNTNYMDLFFMDPSDRDAGWYYKYKSSNIRWSAETYNLTWGSRSWATLAYAADKASTLMGLRCMFWQMPNGNHFFKIMTNTNGHFEDNYTQGFLPSASSNGASGAPGDAISSSSTTSGPGFWANHGLIGVLFGEGYYAGTPTDQNNGDDVGANPVAQDNLTHLRDYGPADGVGTPAGYASEGGPGQGQSTSTQSDNDGGYLRAAVAKYCAVGQFTLPGAALPTATPTACVCSPTFTPTRTPTPADCPLLLNNCDSLTAGGQGTWTVGTTGAGNATQSISTTLFSTGTGSLKVNVTTGATFESNVADLSFSSPVDMSVYDRVTFDVYVDPAHPLTATGATYCGMSIAMDDGSVYTQDPTVPTGSSTGSSPALTLGAWNSLSYPLYWGTAGAKLINGSTIIKFYVIPNLGPALANANSSAVFYVDNIVLHSDKVCPTSTPTPTFNVNTRTPTPTASPTPADCPLAFNSCDSLTSNGTWLDGTNVGYGASTFALNTVGTYVSSGTGSIQVSIGTASSPGGFESNVCQLNSFAPYDWSGYDRITLDVYVDPSHLLTTTAATYCQMQLCVDDSGLYQIPTSALAPSTTGLSPSLAPGWNHLSYPMYWGAANGKSSALLGTTVSKLYLIPSVTDGAAANGAVLYVDNVVLHSDRVCPPATSTFTSSPSVTATRSSTSTATPSPTPTRTSTPTSSSTATLTSTLYPSATISSTNTVGVPPTATVSTTATSTFTPSSTPTNSRTGSPTGTMTDSPTPPPPGSTSTDTTTVAPTATATPSSTATSSLTSTRLSTATATGSVTVSPSLTASPAGTFTDSPTLPPSATSSSTITVGPSRTASSTASPSVSVSPSFTAGPSLTATPTASPSATSTLTQSMAPSRTSSATWTLTASPSVSPSVTLSQTPPPPGSTLTASPSDTPGIMPSPSQTAPPGTPQLVTLNAGVTGQGISYINLVGANFMAGAVVIENAVQSGVVGASVTVTAVFDSSSELTIAGPNDAGTYLLSVYNPGQVFAGTLGYTLVKAATATVTPGPQGGILGIDDHRPVPNPVVAGAVGKLGVHLTGNADRMIIRIYTPAMVKVAESEVDQVPAGWVTVSLPTATASLHSGLYYYLVQVSRGSEAPPKPVVGRLVLLPINH